MLGEDKKVILPIALKNRCRELRHSQTDAEALLWQILRNRNLYGYKFRRQHPLGPYILDFYCHKARLAVELDGGQHADQLEQDEKRTKQIEKHGIIVIRFWNNEIFQNLEGVVENLLGHLRARTK